jgi:hypothetical protein
MQLSVIDKKKTKIDKNRHLRSDFHVYSVAAINRKKWDGENRKSFGRICVMAAES